MPEMKQNKQNTKKNSLYVNYIQAEKRLRI